MSRSRITCFVLLGAALLVVALPDSAPACASCFGQSDSPLAKGMNMGILSLLGVVVFVLGGFAAFFIYLVKRSSRTPMPPPIPAATVSNPLNNLPS
jgi:hypothetical protein